MAVRRETLTLEETAQVLGIGRSSAYASARTNSLPVPVVKIGRRYVVPRAPLEQVLGKEISVPGASADAER